MSDLPTISYSPDTGGRLVTENAEGPTFDLTARQLAGPLVFGGIWVALGLFNFVSEMLDRWRSNYDALRILTSIVQALLGTWILTRPLLARERVVMRVHAGGFVLDKTAWGRTKVQDVEWNEVKDVFVATGPDQFLYRDMHWLRIELIYNDYRNIATQKLMLGYPPMEVEAVADELDRWRQNAAAATPAVQ